MKKIEFSVGAKAARLIGRENIADVDGALMELIKNAYDADASCVLVRFMIPFPDIPSKTEIAFLRETLSDNDFVQVMKYYDESEIGALQKKELTNDEQENLSGILSSYNSIIVADNGYGMTYETVTSSWMYIGTSDKETNIVSPMGRIKTGAKGIGRFALDKLSKQSSMYTKSGESSQLISWAMNWDQFANAKLISEVSAEIDENDISYKETVAKYFGDFSDALREHDWSTGTLIILSPTREIWNRRLFQKVNTNLSSINPIGSVDRFDVIIKNNFIPEYNYKTELVAISQKDYDYRIKIIYDGDNSFVVKFLRNEIDLSVKKVTIEKYNQVVEKDIAEFWARDKFQLENHKKEDYNKEIIFDYPIEKLFPDDELEHIKRIGKFDAEMYFMRLDSSDKFAIMKKAVYANRKKIRDTFSGIKIYRDSFKVRPYGDEGSLFDWLGLSVRAQKSPAGVSHPRGQWRVQPYQLVGWVCIGRETNPLLEDMANREGLALTEYYYIFREMLVKAIEEFEYDRQYVCREYGKWIKSIEDELGEYSERVKEEAMKRAQQPYQKKDDNSDKTASDDVEEYDEQRGKSGFSEDELFGTVQKLVEESEQALNDKQILQILSSSGIVLNTFFHEFNAINTQFHVEASQIRSRVNYILKNQEYKGLPAYNPYKRIEVLEKNDKITAAFLDVVMEGLKKENLHATDVHISEEIGRIVDRWKQILEEKHINLEYILKDINTKRDVWLVSIVDLYIILNNFMLNSAWFLEQEHNDNRQIVCQLEETENELVLSLKNNGPALDDKYRFNPDKIFELGETSKKREGKNGDNIEGKIEGTGLGLWVLKETVERNNGTVKVVSQDKGFALLVNLKR